MTCARVAVIEADAELTVQSPAWERLREKLARAQPDLLVLNELPFGIWTASSPTFDQGAWDASVELHDACVERLQDIGVTAVVGTRPRVQDDGARINQGFSWTADTGAVGRHAKQHLPHSEGYWETCWTASGSQAWEPFTIAGIRAGFMICTDIMFPEHARAYGRQAVDLIVCPRATPPRSWSLFQSALQMAATVSGCYVASSNRGSGDSRGFRYEGRGCVVNPWGVLVAQTNARDDVVVVDIDTANVRDKQAAYPCDVD